MEGVEEEYSFCHLPNLWFKVLFGLCQLPFAFVALSTAPRSLGGNVLSRSTQSKALGMDRSDVVRAASHMYLPRDSSISLGSLTMKVFLW